MDTEAETEMQTEVDTYVGHRNINNPGADKYMDWEGVVLMSTSLSGW